MSAIQPMGMPYPGASPHVPPPPAPVRDAPPGDTPTTQSEPYLSAFEAAYAANVAKIDEMRREQAVRMFGLSVGLRRSSMGGFVMPASPPSALGVSVDGVPMLGNNLTGNYAYFDANGDPEGATTFAWLRDGAPISGATGKVYALVGADQGRAIAFRVTPVSTVAPTTGSPVTSSPVNVP